MKRAITQIVQLCILAAVFAVGRNTIAPGGIAWVGQWTAATASTDSSNAAPHSPSAQPDDPPFLTFEAAKAKFADPGVIFLDARDPEDYRAGHIARSIALPFEEFDQYWPDVEPQLPRDREIVAYCSGAECELSLFLARHLRTLGYTKLSIFFGGWSKWQEQGLPADTGMAAPGTVGREGRG